MRKRSRQLIFRWRIGWTGRSSRRRFLHGISWFFLTLMVCLTIASATAPLLAIAPPNPISTEVHASVSAQRQIEQGRQLYEAGQLQEAVEALQQAAQAYRRQDDVLGEAIALSNLALVYSHLGQWTDATAAIATSLSRLDQLNHPAPDTLAQVLDVRGRLEFLQGNAEAALATWEQSAQIYGQLGNSLALTRTHIHQAEALQALGLYRRAITTLTSVVEGWQNQPDTLDQGLALRSLGDALRITGNLERSQQVLQQSLELATRLANPEAIAAAQFSLANTLYAQNHLEAALAAYQQAAQSSTLLTQTQALLNQLRVLLELKRETEAAALVPAIATRMDQLPLSRAGTYAAINFAQSLATLSQASEQAGDRAHLENAAQRLAIAIQQAQSLADVRAESFALGHLGQLYEQQQQWPEAQRLTEQALQLSQTVNAADVAYLWQWQLGRILNAQHQREGAIAAYDAAVKLLQSLRSDLVAVNAEVQFSFRESVEPLHRQLVSLLLDPTAEETPAALEQARKTIESLQLAELDNFFREACLDAREVDIDQIDRQAAVIYPIILTDRLEVIFRLPGKPLQRYTAFVAASEVEATVMNLRQSLKQVTANHRVLPLAKQVYDWLIRPVRAQLDDSGVKTLVFVLDGGLRNLPMATLHDGEHYLLEDYRIALTPGLQLLESTSLQQQPLRVLLGGISEAHDNFSALPNVLNEFAGIQSEVASQVLLNQNFTRDMLQAAISETPFPVLHLATHGKFSSQLEETFILTWNHRININELHDLLQTSELTRRRPIELLVLSACQTADGDNRAALGLAGVAVRAGARSTLASLWQVSDEATAQLMVRFYQELGKAGVTKAEALRQAQLSLLNGETPIYSIPYYWSSFVLVGNWL